MDRVRAFGLRRAIAFTEWRARRELKAETRRAHNHRYRAFIQVNMIRNR